MFLTIVFTISYVSCNRDKADYIIGLNENIHHDDFEYSVTGYTSTPSLAIGANPRTSMGNFYLVRFKVENRAKRIDHQWDNSIAYLVDEEGNRYENSKDSQIGLDQSLHFGWKELYNTRFGTSDSTILVFDLPLNVTRPYLMVRGGILMGDAFDGARFRKMKVKLF